MNAWSYRFTDNYTIEVKFKINAIAAGIAFSGYEGFGGNIAVWQFNVGNDGTQSKFRPHDWRVGGVLLEEKGTGSVTLNTTDWFVTKIVISNNGNHADTYLRRDQDGEFVLIDSRDSRFEGEFRYGLIGARQDHDGTTNESATFDYIRVTENATGNNLYYEDFNATNGNWRNEPSWDSAAGTLTVEGGSSERRYFPNNMFQNAVDMHYAVEADVTIESGFISIIFGLTDGGSNYMWQISPNYYGDNGVCNYYHLDNGGENWKAHAAGGNYVGVSASDFRSKRHVKIEVRGNVVYTYIDGTLKDTFTQCDMTDLALLNPGKIGLRADGSNNMRHTAYIDNVKLTEYDKDGNGLVTVYEPFSENQSCCFDLTSGVAVVDVGGGDYALKIDVSDSKVRLISTSSHSYVKGICETCGACEEPGFDSSLNAYTIGNLGQLIRYSEIVNGTNQRANGSLTSDIDMENSDKFTPIGLNNDADKQTPFGGTFYGNNHVISNLYVKTNCEGGLFSRLRGGKIYNLGLENGHIESTANLRCGAIAGEHHDNAWMYNCYARGTFEFVTTHSQTNAVAGETAGGHFLNCYTTLPKMSCDYPMSGTSENSYEGVTAGQAETGELCYKLGDAFHQVLGTDTYPGLDTSKPNVYQIAVGGAGYASFVPEVNVATIPTGVTVYAGEDRGSYLHLEEVTEVPADNAFIVKAAEGNYYYNDTDTEITLSKTNDLKFYTTETASTGSQYCLANKASGVGFYQVESGVTIPARKAYLQVSSPVKAFYGFDEDDATSINEELRMKKQRSTAEGKVNEEFYKQGSTIVNLAGQRISKMRKGINIINGKKFLF